MQSNNTKTFTTIFLIIIVAVAVFAGGILLGKLLSPHPEGPAVIPPPPAMDGPHIITNDYVNVRSGPSTDYPSYGVTAPGQAAQVIGTSPDGRWWVIVIPTNIAPDSRGWISADYVIPYNTFGVPIIEPPPMPFEMGE